MATAQTTIPVTTTPGAPSPTQKAAQPGAAPPSSDALKAYVVAATAPAGQSADKVFFPFFPVEVNYEGWPADYGELERPGRKPLLQYKGGRLRKVSFDATFVTRGTDASIEDVLQDLADLAASDVDVRLKLDGLVESTVWRITDLTFASRRRSEVNAVTQATVSITLTEATKPTTVVPGMQTIKDVPQSSNRTSSKKKSSSSTGARTVDKYSKIAPITR